MIIGQYEGTIADKYQTAIPKRFRESLGDQLVVTKGFDPCLVVIAQDNWKDMVDEAEGNPFADKTSRDKQRFISGNAVSIEVDAKGRFVLPEYLRRYANLKENIVYVGVKTFFEIWDKETWNEKEKQLMEDMQPLSQ